MEKRPKTKKCSTCRGTGRVPSLYMGGSCLVCGERGRVLVKPRRAPCFACAGKKGLQCKNCKGAGTVLTHVLP